MPAQRAWKAFARHRANAYPPVWHVIAAGDPACRVPVFLLQGKTCRTQAVANCLGGLHSLLQAICFLNQAAGMGGEPAERVRTS